MSEETINPVFDFGFTFADEDEIDAVQDAEASSDSLQDRLDTLYNSIQPLLNNLKGEPSKDYIFWPDRLGKIEAYETYITKVYQGNS